jgi:hypothetical protein
VPGLTGAGGGILAVPALVMSMNWSLQQAAPVALLAVAGSAAVGAVEGLRSRLVRYRAGFVVAACGLPFISLGLVVAHMSSQRWLSVLFALVMLITAVRTLRQARHAAHPPPEGARGMLARMDPQTGRLVWTWPTALLLAGIGAVTGFMTGLLGVGGGFVIVPALRRYTNISIHGIVATSLFVIALLGVGGVLGALAHGVKMPFAATICFVVAMTAGMLIGRVLSHRLSARRVQQGFGILLLVAALALLLERFTNS